MAKVQLDSLGAGLRLETAEGSHVARLGEPI
jgi:hypothetical protein